MELERKYLWAVLLCKDELTGDGSFTTLMPHPPIEGRTVEFYDTPYGDFSGEIFHVNEAIQFMPCPKQEFNHSFGITKGIEVLPSIVQYQVWIEYTRIK